MTAGASSSSPITPPPAYSPRGFLWPPTRVRDLNGLQRHIGEAALRAQNPVSMTVDDISGFPQTTVIQRGGYPQRAATIGPSKLDMRLIRHPLQLHHLEQQRVPLSREEEDIKKRLGIAPPSPVSQRGGGLSQEEDDLKRRMGLRSSATASSGFLQGTLDGGGMDGPHPQYRGTTSPGAETTHTGPSTLNRTSSTRRRPTADDLGGERKRRNSNRRNVVDRTRSDKRRDREAYRREQERLERRRSQRRREGVDRVAHWRQSSAFPDPFLTRQSSLCSIHSISSVPSLSRSNSVSSVSSSGHSHGTARLPRAGTFGAAGPVALFPLSSARQRLVTPGPLHSHGRNGSQSSQESSLQSMLSPDGALTEVMMPLSISGTFHHKVRRAKSKASRSKTGSFSSRRSASSSRRSASSSRRSASSSRRSASSSPTGSSISILCRSESSRTNQRGSNATASVTDNSLSLPPSRSHSVRTPPSSPPQNVNKPLPAIQFSESPRRMTPSPDPLIKEGKARHRHGFILRARPATISEGTSPADINPRQKLFDARETASFPDDQQEVDFEFSGNSYILKDRALPTWKRYLTDAVDIMNIKWRKAPTLPR